MPPETITKTETAFEGVIFNVEVRHGQLTNGSPVRRDVVVNRGAVVIVPITPQNEVRLVRQYRAAAEKWVYELPAGGLEIDEDPDEAAPRELIEETGDQAATWHKLPGFYSAPGIFNEYLHLYLATDLTPGPNQLEFDEHIEVRTIPWDTALAMIQSGEIEDAKTIAGLLSAGLKLKRFGDSTTQ